jgi:hypothetical protein
MPKPAPNRVQSLPGRSFSRHRSLKPVPNPAQTERKACGKCGAGPYRHWTLEHHVCPSELLAGEGLDARIVHAPGPTDFYRKHATAAPVRWRRVGDLVFATSPITGPSRYRILPMLEAAELSDRQRASTRRPSSPSLASRAPLLMRRSCELCLSSSSTGCARYTSAAATWRGCSSSGRLRRIKSRHDTMGPGPMPRV